MTQPASMMVVDASVATKWHLTDEEHVQKARLLLSRFAQGTTELFAPQHIRYEVPSAITLATRRRAPRLTREQGEAAIHDFRAIELALADYS